MTKLVHAVLPPCDVEAAPAQDTEALLATRGSTHGKFAANASISQSLKYIMRHTTGWERLSDVQRESLELISLKVSRILSGQAEYADHWDDIAGYAKLARDNAPEA